MERQDEAARPAATRTREAELRTPPAGFRNGLAEQVDRLVVRAEGECGKAELS